MPADEITVPFAAPMPRGYTFVSKGNVYITAHCRRATHAAGKPVYVVVRSLASAASSSAQLGLRCPYAIVAAVRAAERGSRSTRRAATAKRDAALAAAFRDALLAAYPAIPRATVPQIVRHAMAKRQGRVARTGTLGLAARVRLAVRAHIRHRNTAYEALLRGGTTTATAARPPKKGTPTGAISREAARAQIVGQVDTIERAWAGKGDEADEANTVRGRGAAKTAVKSTAKTAAKTTTKTAAKTDCIEATRSSKREATARIARYSQHFADGDDSGDAFGDSGLDSDDGSVVFSDSDSDTID